jgi:pathogenesis-related protein 1
MPRVYRNVKHLFVLLVALAAIAPAQPRLAEEMLDAHNQVRSRVKVAPLQWSHQLASRAQDWANSLLTRGQFLHRPKSPYGENLFEIRGTTASPSMVVDAWAGEAPNYDYKSNRCRRGMCGHYTQVIWASTQQVGCAVARNRSREVWVCNYDPPGNWVGQRPY